MKKSNIFLSVVVILILHFLKQIIYTNKQTQETATTAITKITDNVYFFVSLWIVIFFCECVYVCVLVCVYVNNKLTSVRVHTLIISMFFTGREGGGIGLFITLVPNVL